MGILVIIGSIVLLVLSCEISSRESKQKWDVISSYKCLLREEDWLELEECRKKHGVDAAIALFEKNYEEYAGGECFYKGYFLNFSH